VASDTAAGQRVGDLLRRASEAAGDDADAGELADLLRDDLLPALSDEHAAARPFKRLEPWVGGVTAELSHAAERVERAASGAPGARSAGPARGRAPRRGAHRRRCLRRLRPPARAALRAALVPAAQPLCADAQRGRARAAG